MKFVNRACLPKTPAEAFAWHMRPGELERLTPPWEDIEVLHSRGRPDREGYQVEFSRGLWGPFRRRWLAERRGIQLGSEFRDDQLAGPFTRFEHTHRFLAAGGLASEALR
jgi:uncharacterized protein